MLAREEIRGAADCGRRPSASSFETSTQEPQEHVMMPMVSDSSIGKSKMLCLRLIGNINRKALSTPCERDTYTRFIGSHEAGSRFPT